MAEETNENSPLAWYAAYTRSRLEVEAYEEAWEAGAENVLLPAWQIENPRAAAKLDPSRLRESLFFPRYILLQSREIQPVERELERSQNVLYVCGTKGGGPSPIPDGEIAVVRHLMAMERRPDLGSLPEKGRRAVVVQGAMAGVEGIVVWRNKERARLMTEISFMGRAVEIEAPLQCLVLKDYYTASGEYKPSRRGGRRGRAQQRKRDTDAA